MVTGRETMLGCAANFLRGRKCIFCGSFNVNRMARGYVKCGVCGKQKSLTRLKREIAILTRFYRQQPAYRLAGDLGVDAKMVTRSLPAFTYRPVSGHRVGRGDHVG